MATVLSRDSAGSPEPPRGVQGPQNAARNAVSAVLLRFMDVSVSYCEDRLGGGGDDGGDGGEGGSRLSAWQTLVAF